MPGRLGFTLVAALALAANAAACGGSGNDEAAMPTPLPGGDEQFVRTLCVSITDWKASFAEVWADKGHSLAPKDMLPLFEDFIGALETTRASELEDVRTVWLSNTRANVERIERGETDVAWDPFETVPTTTSSEDDALLEELTHSIPECVDVFRAPPAAGFWFPVDIDYSNPAAYLDGATQSTFTGENASAVKAELGTVTPDLAGVGVVYRWVRTFRGAPSGGADIGKTDVNGLLAARTVTGCHDSALIMAAVLRLYGMPAVMVDTAGIQWAEDFLSRKTQAYAGHVMAEVYVSGDWILVDCTTGMYVADYDPAKAVIAPTSDPGMDPKGWYVLFKGFDPADYGVKDLHQRMRAFASMALSVELEMTRYEWKPLP